MIKLSQSNNQNAIREIPISEMKYYCNNVTLVAKTSNGPSSVSDRFGFLALKPNQTIYSQ